jgi:hypothetical protein
VVGWLNTKKFLETGDAAKSQGWTALIVDTSGDGQRGEYTEPGKDMRIGQVFYAVMPSPVDGTVWGTIRANPGAVVRLNPGTNPPETALSEIYNVAAPGFGPRGGDIDSKGVVWVSLASGHLGSFDRRKCKGPLNGPNATGNQCPEGWSFYNIRARVLKASAITPPSRAITPGSTSITRWGSATTSRSPPPISTTAWSPMPTEK